MSNSGHAAVVLFPAWRTAGPAGPIEPARIDRFLDGAAVDLLVQYFDAGGHDGGRFERFAGGGDQGPDADRFTSDDFVAISLLGVRLHGQPMLAVLESRQAEFNALLAAIPRHVDLWAAPEETVGPGSASDRLWRRLVELPRVSGFAAGNLLARKRPRLVPVSDRLVMSALGRQATDEWWRPLRTVLVDNPALVARLEELRALASVGPDIALLRVLDVCIRMRAAPGRHAPAIGG
jgi:hypothetical protein